MNKNTAVCVECGKPPPEGTKLSKKGYCYLCSYGHAREAAEQLHAHQGPYYEKWLESMKRGPDNLEDMADKMRERWLEGMKWRARSL